MNRKVNLRRRDLELLEATLTNCVRVGPVSQNRERLPDFRAHLQGKIGFVEMVNPMVMGWVNYFRHTNASQAFRGLQRFVNIRFRRYLTQRSKGRGFGWKRFPNSKLYAMGLAYIGSGLLTYRAKPAHDGRRRLSDRRTREN